MTLACRPTTTVKGDPLPPAEEQLLGLTSDEVSSRVEQGLVNVATDVRTKSVGQIVATNLCTLFNAVNLVLALLVIWTGEYRNLMFVLVVLSNLGIGIFQEIRSKIALDRLSILASRDVEVVRDGREVGVPLHSLVLDDLVRLSRGDQVPADCEVVRGRVLMDESLLTGESVAVERGAGDTLLSGSFVDAGSAYARVSRVGADGYAARITAEAKHHKPPSSEIMRTLRGIIRFATVALVPLGIALFLRARGTGQDVEPAVLTTVAAVVGMIPQGLVLLTSSVLAIATTRLARRDVLVDQLYCIETLARVDVLCLDKTGTITTGAMEVMGVRAAAGVGEDDLVGALGQIIAAGRDDANETARAIATFLEGHAAAAPDHATRHVPFSSARKYSGCVTADGRSLAMGAAQFVMGTAASTLEGELRSFGETARVLVVAEVDGFDDDDRIVGQPRLLGFVALRDQVRETAAQTIEYFVSQGVTLDVISGDDPVTVSAIAQSVGVPDARRWVDASTLEGPEEIREAARAYRVFGRVTPEVKRELVRALKEDGHVVAMTGDGVNDVLALKEADCSVAMASGSDAARNVAEVVLVDNDFAHMPEVVAEGRRSINNLQRSASLFLVKTVFSVALAAICVMFPPYPFLPVQMSMLSGAVIGVPSFVLALEPNRDRVRGNFLANVLARSIPASVAILCGICAVMVAGRMGEWGFNVTSTTCTLVTALVGVALIVRISLPLTRLRSALLAFVVLMLVVEVGPLRGFFLIMPLHMKQLVYLAFVGTCGIILFWKLFDVSVVAASPGGVLARLAEGRGGSHVD